MPYIKNAIFKYSDNIGGPMVGLLLDRKGNRSIKIYKINYRKFLFMSIVNSFILVVH